MWCNLPRRIIEDPVRLGYVRKVTLNPSNCSEKETGKNEDLPAANATEVGETLAAGFFVE